MKMCDECGMNPANIHLTQIMNDETHIFHLCDECAKKKGINISVNEEAFEDSTQQPQVPDKICTKCGLKYSEFKSKGWLGCAQCYTAFESEIDELLVQVHGSSIHKGKKYAGVAHTEIEVTVQIKRLRHELAAAIKNEEFEQAAVLRDAIHNLKQTGV